MSIVLIVTVEFEAYRRLMIKRNVFENKTLDLNHNEKILFYCDQSFTFVNSLLPEPSNFNLLITLNDNKWMLVGFLSFGINEGSIPTYIKIREIFILKHFRNKGFGSMVLSFFNYLLQNEDVSMVYLVTLKRNIDALRFYKMHYFRIYKIKDNSFSLFKTKYQLIM